MAKYGAGFSTQSITDPRRSRPILIDLWYPVEPVSAESKYDYQPGSGSVAKDAAPCLRHAPAVVLSHGAFGAARNYSWIAEHLARNGYVVAGVSHYGESFAFGPQTIDPSMALRPWLRAQDCSYIVDYLADDSRLCELIDIDRVGALGHSSGGATVLELVGAKLDLAAMQRYCLSQESADDKGCQYARGASNSLVPDLVEDLLDPRVKVVVAMDPALGPGHTEESLRRITAPVYIIGSAQNDFLPYAHHAGRYASLIGAAKHTALTTGEGHFVFLNEGNSDAQANGVALYKDRAGVSRAQVHKTLGDSIVEFFDPHLGTA